MENGDKRLEIQWRSVWWWWWWWWWWGPSHLRSRVRRAVRDCRAPTTATPPRCCKWLSLQPPNQPSGERGQAGHTAALRLRARFRVAMQVAGCRVTVCSRTLCCSRERNLSPTAQFHRASVCMAESVWPAWHGSLMYGRVWLAVSVRQCLNGSLKAVSVTQCRYGSICYLDCNAVSV
jgi:hypothetical protein